MENRREFIKKSAVAGLGLALPTVGISASSYNRIVGSNERVRVGIIGFSTASGSRWLPRFEHAKNQNFAFVGVSDIWSRRRDEADAYLKGKGLNDSSFFKARNNDELLDRKDVDAVIISTADFQHALHCVAAVESGRDAYCEKPFAETLDDARKAVKAVESSKRLYRLARNDAQRLITARPMIISNPVNLVISRWLK